MVFNRDVQPPSNVTIYDFVPKGSKEAFIILNEELRKGAEAKILVYYDPDIDGLMSGLLVEQYLESLGMKNKYYRHQLNSNRTHGFKLSDEELEKFVGYTIIAVDFSVEKEDFDRILKHGINLIVIDHHEINIKNYTKSDVDFVLSCYRKKGTYGVILNNQYPTEPESFRFLSGAGMVYYFLKYVGEKINWPVYADAPAMVGLTLLSDVRVLESKEARNFLKYTFNLKSDFMKFLNWLVSRESQSAQRFTPFGVPCNNRNFIDFTLSPSINSLLRADKGEIALNLLRGVDEVVNMVRQENLIEKYKDAQKGLISMISKEIEESANVPGSLTQTFSKLQICCIYGENGEFRFPTYPLFNVTNYIGVACSRIKEEGKTCAVFVIDKHTNKVIRGSVRGNQDGVDYLEIFKHNGVPSAGHKNAFGILECDISEVDFEKINQEIELLEDKYAKEHINTRSVLEVYNLSIFMKSPQVKKICEYNELSRDSHRIYIKFTGDTDDPNRVKADKVSNKYIKYSIDGVSVDCFDPSIDIKDALIVIGFENNKYMRCTLREGFEYNVEQDKLEIKKKLSSLLE